MPEFSDDRPTLLVVEDDDQVRGFVKSLLAQDKIRIIEARTGAEGLEVGLAAGSLDVLLTDMLLPELSGYDVALKLREAYPCLRIIMMTGYVEGEIVLKSVQELQAMFIDKPFQAAQLRKLVLDAIASSRESVHPLSGAC